MVHVRDVVHVSYMRDCDGWWNCGCEFKRICRRIMSICVIY